MSWGGPAIGAPPFQAPYPNGPPASYNQYQNGPSYPVIGPVQKPPETRPPKKKGNPIITRYPPPPGYRGPAQPQGPFGQNQYPNQYQPPAPTYPQGYPSAPAQGYSAPPSYPPNQGYPPANYNPPQNYPPQPNYPQQQYPTPQNYQYQPQGYPPAHGFQQHSGYPPVPAYPTQQTGYQAYPPQPAPVDPGQQAYAQSQTWQPPHSQVPYSASDPHNPYGSASQDPNATPTPVSAHPASTQNNSTAGQPETSTSDKGVKSQLFLPEDDWDFDFEGAIWPKSNEEVNPNLTLGVIIWRPAKQVTRALPSTFEAAEEQALKPPAEKLGNGESVSTYFSVDNSHEAFLDVRQTDDWRKVKNDPVFVEFPPRDQDTDFISIKECIAMIDRPDEPVEETNEDEDEDMQDSNWNIMDNLEQALSEEAGGMKPPISAKSQGPETNQTQEDVLAMLGVTGTPKPPSNEPISLPFSLINSKPPASLPEKPPVAPDTRLLSHSVQRAHSFTAPRNAKFVPPVQRPYGSMSSSTPKRPAPPPDRSGYNPWNSGSSARVASGHAFDGSHDSPTRSEGSNRTLAGSDVDDKPVNGLRSAEDTATGSVSETMPNLERSDNSFSRKRSYDDTDQNDEKVRQQDDHTKRKRRSQVAAAYGRR